MSVNDEYICESESESVPRLKRADVLIADHSVGFYGQ